VVGGLVEDTLYDILVLLKLVSVEFLLHRGICGVEDVPLGI